MTLPFSISVWPLGLLVFVYLISMYFLVRMFSKTLRAIRQQRGNGLEFYRKLVAITIAVVMVDSTYAIITRIVHLFYPLQDYLLYGIVPIVVKTLVLFCVWGFHCIQSGDSLCWLSLKFWKDKLGL